ncbi:SDR family NAD(P)-dependent oxidoreductase [Methylobacterium platani]|uniref:Oxidoreductase n=2 Tax=Methylobacterium platani TaxID=427683 RepID=A0A179SIV3_9HYPH|nr:SDR family NAD(P)-dependent oxidoreductase [Methylobacterium platani]KMO16109.1 oxidoreductase [Methylobacterium platani JCM 14648]OAS27687.1 oxidoreductase [Methylobacterium platani]
MARFTDKAVLVTGAGSGIGRASALHFAREGAAVAVVDRDPGSVEETAALIAAEGGRALALAADAGREGDVTGFLAAAEREFGRLDAIHANAGIGGGTVPFAEQSVALWEEVLRVNLIGAFLAIKHGAPLLLRHGGGAIVCTASVAGLRANAAGAAYSASKAGVISLVQTAADAFAGTGLRINAVCPGLIETGMTAGLFAAARAKGKADRIGQLNPSRRAGAPEEIAAAAVFLASEDASYVNGQALAVDGGLSSTHPFVPRPPKG